MNGAVADCFLEEVVMNYLRSLSPALRCPSSWKLDMAGLNKTVESIFCNPWSLLLCKILIGIVSVYDIYLTIKYVEYLGTYELNPVGRWLMDLDRGPECNLKQVAAFVSAKFAGNFIALSVIELLANWKRYIATAVAFPVVVFQLGLLYFLMFGSTH